MLADEFIPRAAGLGAIVHAAATPGETIARVADVCRAVDARTAVVGHG